MPSTNGTNYFFESLVGEEAEEDDHHPPLPETPESRLYREVVLQTIRDAALASTRKQGRDARSYKEAMRDSRLAIGYILSGESENDLRTILEWGGFDPDLIYELRSRLRERHSAKWLADVLSCYDKQDK